MAVERNTWRKGRSQDDRAKRHEKMSTMSMTILCYWIEIESIYTIIGVLPLCWRAVSLISK